MAFLKPLSPDAATNIALVCESGRIYSFLVAEQSDGPPHLVVRFESDAEKTGLSGSGTGRPAFVARSEVAAYQQMAAEAAEAARSAREAAEAGILEARSQAESAIEEFRARYPERLAFEYRLDGGRGRPAVPGRSDVARTGSSPTSAPAPRSRPRSMSSGTASRRSWLTI